MQMLQERAQCGSHPLFQDPNDAVLSLIVNHSSFGQNGVVRECLENHELLPWPKNGGDPPWKYIFYNGERVSQIQAKNLNLIGPLPQSFNQLTIIASTCSCDVIFLIIAVGVSILPLAFILLDNRGERRLRGMAAPPTRYTKQETPSKQKSDLDGIIKCKKPNQTFMASNLTWRLEVQFVCGHN
ncbi:hypothetical protein PIB30_069253 [Stylosanthes scabra]|uniref:Uncharacterized protein n=1 Tax=Stylosanthes scabra TaxID=79078 RepID=A0ABU6ZLT1_9FABA|nr:hypothetical protein [Stylosanthes scabra]